MHLVHPEAAAPKRSSRKVKIPEVFGVAEVARELGITPSNLQYVKGLPDPIQQLRCSQIWLADEVRAFAKVYQARREARLAKAS